MGLQRILTLAVLIPLVLGVPNAGNFQEYSSLEGLSSGSGQAALWQTPKCSGPQPLPPPIQDMSAKLVYDANHPFEPLRPGDIRGPCPGLNTLASHGYINRSGVTTPGEIITAVQEGFNMGWQFASFLTYSEFIISGNHLSNWMSIGQDMSTTGSSRGCDQHSPGLETRGTFEGDARISRQDKYFGHNLSFNSTMFHQLIDAASDVGGGYVTVEAAALDRRRRIDDSIARNPVFAFETPRFLGAAAQSGFALAMFVHNQSEDTSKSLAYLDAWSFFSLHKFPEGFVRRQGPYEFPHVKALTYKLIDMVGRRPGHNEGVHNYVVNPEDPATFCYFYQKQVNSTAQLYGQHLPHKLKEAIKANLVTYYEALGDKTCKQYFPYGH